MAYTWNQSIFLRCIGRGDVFGRRQVQTVRSGRPSGRMCCGSLILASVLMSFPWAWFHPAHADITKTVTPRVSVTETYDDNIDLTPTNEISDWITTVSPGISLELESPQTVLNFDYEAGFSFYRDESSRDNTRHRAEATWNQELSRQLTFHLSDRFLRSEDPVVEREGMVEDIRSRRDTEYRNTAEASLAYAFGAEDRITGGYIHQYVDDRSSANEDSEGNRGFLNLDKWFGPRYGIRATSHVERGTFEQEDDFDQYAVGLTLNRRWTPSRLGYVRYDFLDHDYEEAAGAPRNDFQLHQGVIGADWGLGPATTLRAEIGYYLQDYQQGGDSDGLTYRAGLVTGTRRTTYVIEGGGGYDQDYYSSDNFGTSQFYEFSGRADHQLRERLGVYLAAQYRRDKYRERNNQQDKIYGARAGISWSFWRWFTLNLEGARISRDSDDPAREFDDNRIMLRATGAYPHRF